VLPGRLARNPNCNFLGMLAQKEGTKTGIPYFTSLSEYIYYLKIALLTESLPSAMAKSTALQSNLDVDFVISYRYAKTGMFVFVVG
jgi:anoctamin-10